MSRTPAFGVNGRFLSQPITGVQRYARAVVKSLDRRLAEQGESAPIFAPRGASDPALSAMPLVPVGPFSGYAWEQFVLPARFDGPLLNLCNMAPVARSNQVLCIHDVNVFNAPTAYGHAFRTIYAALQPLLARRAAHITTVSAFSAREIARCLPIAAEAISVLPNGHEHALAWDPACARPEIAASIGERDGSAPPFVLALGSRAKHKNLRLLLDLSPALDDLGVDLVIAGGGNAIFAAEPLEAHRNVRMTGYVTDDDLAFLMDRALCLAFPSWTEGFGLPVIEAMTRGCPVISSDRASLPEVCGAAALMAAPDDPSRWVDHVRALLRSEALREDLIGRGREQAQRFSWDKTAAGYAELMTSPAARIPASGSPAGDLPRMAVVVATTGRPDVVSATVHHLLETQSLRPATIIVSCVRPEDAGDLARSNVTIVSDRPGLAAQRNTALAALPPDIEIVVFFDDDFVADPGWLAAAAQTFRDRPQIVGLTGQLLADGIKGPGLSFAEAVKLIEEAGPSRPWTVTEPYSPYGCNMAFRVSAIGDLKFDERLVLYGWLEDRDFGAALARRGGRLVQAANAIGVHMGVKSGRVAGDRLGYSQVVNPIYLRRKGTMTTNQVADHLFRNLASNVVRSAKPEPFIDRRGRLKGNLRGLTDVLCGRLQPERAIAVATGEKR